MIDWSDDEKTMRAGLRKFVDAEIRPRRRELEFGGLPPYEILREMYSTFGLAELAVERFDRSLAPRNASVSRTRDPLELATVLLPLIEVSRCSPGMVTAMGVSANLASGAILKAGTAEQKRRWALDLMTMDKIGSWAITEPGSGSDAFGGMRAVARREGDGYILNGSKTFITNGPYADTIVFICRSTEVNADGRHSILTFVLDKGMPGLEQTKPLQKMGMHSSPTGELYLTDVRAGADRLLGGPERSRTTTAGPKGGGAKGAFASERASIAATALGIIEQCLEFSVAYANDRVQFGKRIGDFQLIQDKLAAMESARFNVQNSLFYYIECLTTGRGISFAEASAMKLYAARAATETALAAVQIHGGNGYMSEFPVEQLARDAKVLQIYAGTDEMQIVGIAKELLRV